MVNSGWSHFYILHYRYKYSLPVILNSSVIKRKYFSKEKWLINVLFFWHHYMKGLFVDCNLASLVNPPPHTHTHHAFLCTLYLSGFLSNFLFPQQARTCAFPHCNCHHLVILFQCPPHLFVQVTSYNIYWARAVTSLNDNFIFSPSITLVPFRTLGGQAYM